MTEPRQTTRPPDGDAPPWWDEFARGSNGLPPPRGFPDLSQELVSDNGTATLRLAIPFVEKADVELKKIGLEVIVRVGPQKRTIILPPTMAAYRPRGAQFEDGALSVTFERASDDRATADDTAS